MLVLSREDVQRALPMEEAIRAVRTSMLHLSCGMCTLPERLHLDLAEHDGTSLVMPCYSAATNRLVTKVINLHRRNLPMGLPRIHSVVLLFDATCGIPLALMDGAMLTALRTGAGSAIATELLARPDAERAAIFGAGPQGRTQLEAICSVRRIRTVSIYDPNAELAERFARDMSAALGVDVWTASDPAVAMDGADVVCTATASETPVLCDCNVRPGMHINSIGAYKPHTRELPSATVARARVFVDYREGVLAEAGDILIPIAEGLIGPDHIVATLGELLRGHAHGRMSAEDITLYKSVGVAAQDLAAASAAYERARLMGIGSEVHL